MGVLGTRCAASDRSFLALALDPDGGLHLLAQEALAHLDEAVGRVIPPF